MKLSAAPLSPNVPDILSIASPLSDPLFRTCVTTTIAIRFSDAILYCLFWFPIVSV